jgi:hypothetical protein
MKTILKPRAKSQAPAAAPSSTPPAGEQATPPKYTPRGGSKNRILVAVKDNRIDFQAMSSEASKDLNNLLHEPEVQAQFGIGPLTQGFDPQHCKRIYQALGIVFVGIGKTVMKFPLEAALKLQYTDAEQEELAKPTASVLDEMAPKWLRENQALASLLLVFGAMTQNKLREAAALAMEIRKQQAAQAGSGGGSQPAAAPPAQAPPATETRSRVPIAIVPQVDVHKANGVDHSEPPNFGGAGGVGPRA